MATTQTADFRPAAPTRQATSSVNVGKTERLASLAGGAALALYGLARRDLAGAFLALASGGLIFRGLTGHDPIYQALDINRAVADRQHAVSVPHEQGIHITESVTIARPVEELYHWWRNFSNLPRIMDNVESVLVLPDGTTHWFARGPGGKLVEWEAGIINEVPGEVIGWRTLEGAPVSHAGAVRFSPAPGDQGAEVKVEMEYTPPAGGIGGAIAKLMGQEPGQLIHADLRRFKMLMETGEIATIEGQTSGRKRRGGKR